MICLCAAILCQKAVAEIKWIHKIFSLWWICLFNECNLIDINSRHLVVYWVDIITKYLLSTVIAQGEFECFYTLGVNIRVPIFRQRCLILFIKSPYPGKWYVFILALLYFFRVFEWVKATFRKITTFRNIRWQRNQLSKKTNYDKMSAITCLSFRSTHFLMLSPCHNSLPGKFYRANDLIISF